MDVFREIENLTEENIHEAVEAVLEKYRQLFPDWEIATFAISKKEDRDAQIDRLMELLEKLRTSR